MGDATLILGRLNAGDKRAHNELLPLVYDELRRLARGHSARQRSGHTLQATDLVHEAFMRLIRPDGQDYDNRGHFMAVASTAMRQILTDHARKRGSQKRGGDWDRVTLTGVPESEDTDPTDVLAIDRALKKLAELNSRHARVVEMRVFGGSTLPEIAEALGAGQRTVEKDWRLAKAWLARELSRR